MPCNLVLDSNLTLLLVVGMLGPAAIRTHKRLQEYDTVDFRLLSNVLDTYDAILFSPNVLSETSNLVRCVRDPLNSRAAACLSTVICAAEERVVISRTAVQDPDYTRLGLTDAVMLTKAAAGSTLLTADLDLYLAAVHRSI